MSRTILSGRYALDDNAIGKGGFADVYRAVDLTQPDDGPHSVVAVKVLRELSDQEVRRRFERELRLVRVCNHPNIMPILNTGENDIGQLWYAMPLAKGSLDDDIESFVGKEDRILQLMRQVCDGLAYVHAKGIYHRDLKPANILRLGPTSWAISDFGLAREAERTTTALTSTLQGVGTFFFAAPEAWKGAKHAEAPADIFSLGKILQQLSTGELPITTVVSDTLFRGVILKATRQEAVQRYQSVNELRAALEGIAAAPNSWRPTEQIVDDLADRLRSEVPDESALRQLLTMVEAATDHVALASDLGQTLPLLSRGAIEWLWREDAESITALLETYGHLVRGRSWDFSFCDTIADFLERVVLVTGDDNLLRVALKTLFELGASHNRWHVRDVAISVLQRIRTNQAALAAAEAVRESIVSGVRWTLTDFVIRSLHPTIRDELDRALPKEAP